MIAAGAFHSLALTAAGTIVGWGSSNDRESSAPYGLSNVVAIAAGKGHSLALKSDGTVRAWGYNVNGETQAPPDLTNVISISSGESYSLALKSDGTVKGWGWGSATNVPLWLTNAVAVAAGHSHSLALRSDGTVVAWGFSGTYNRTNVPLGLTNAVAIACGYAHNLVLKSDGTIKAWGDNFFGQTTVPASATNIIAIEAGRNHSLALRADGKVFCWGDTTSRLTSPPSNATNIIAIAGGDFHNLVLLGGAPVMAIQPTNQSTYSGHTIELTVRALGTLPLTHQWFFNNEPLDGFTNSSFRLENLTPEDSGSYFVVVSNRFGSVTSSIAAVTAPHSAPLVLQHPESVLTHKGARPIFRAYINGSLPMSKQWRLNGKDLIGATNDTLTLDDVPIGAAGEYSIVVSNGYGVVSSSNAMLHVNNIVAWSGNQWTPTNCPIGLSNVVSIATKGSHNLVLTADDKVVSWGDNTYGQSDVPQSVSNTLAVVTGGWHCLALRQDGTVVSWGRNNYGQTNVPSGLTDVVAIAAADTRSLALKADGTVVSWGYPTNIPPEATEVVSIAAGSVNVALKANGHVVDWTSNYDLSSLTDVVSVTSGDHRAALKRDGTVFRWGGLGSTYEVVQLGLSNVVSIDAGPGRTLALMADGTVAEHAGFPVPSGLKNIRAVAAGYYHNLALIGDTLPTVTTLPRNVVSYSGKPFSWTARVAGQVDTYRWFFNGNLLADATNASLTLPATTGTNSGIYELVVCNAAGCSTNQIRLFVSNSAPYIVRAPTDVVSYRTGSAILELAADGSNPLTYEWFFNGAPIVGLTSPSIHFRNLTSGDAGEYGATIQSPFGSTNIAPVRLFVNDVVAWGTTNLAQTNVPPGLTNIVSVASGRYHTLALRADGRVLAWGDERTVKGAAYGGTNMSLSHSNIIAIAGGGFHSLLLTATGKVVAVGSNQRGQCNVPGGATNIVALSGGLNHSVALDGDGRVTAWGDNRAQQTNVPGTLSNVVAIAAGDDHNVALSSSGDVVAWGSNGLGQTNVPAGLSNVVAIAAGERHTLALDASGRVTAWGYWVATNVPATATNVVMIAAAGDHSIALKTDGTIVTWGETLNGSHIEAGLTNVVAISAGTQHNVALIGDGELIPRLGEAVFRNNSLTLRWNCIPNRRYRIQGSSDLNAGGWADVSNDIYAHHPICSAIIEPAGEMQRFYRIKLLTP